MDGALADDDAGRWLRENVDFLFAPFMDTDGVDEPYHFEVALTVSGDEIVADYTGTSPQQPRAINCVYAYTYAMTAYAVRCALLSNLANNEGMYRPVKVRAPEGCLLNPRWPAAVVSRSNTGHYVPTLVFGALHQVVPDRVMAGVGSPLWAVTQSGVRGAARRTPTSSFITAAWGRRRRRMGRACCRGPATSRQRRWRWRSATARSSFTTSACAPVPAGPAASAAVSGRTS
jgi:N-methylhydantoinase B